MKKSKINIRKIKSKNIFKVVFLFLFCFLGVFVFLNRENVLNPNLTVLWLKDIFKLPKKSEGFPIKIENEKIKAQNLKLVNGNIVLVSNTSYKCFNKNGNLISSMPHSFFEPVLKTCEDKILIFDLNNGNLQIGFKSTPIDKIKFENKIMAASIANDATYAVAYLTLAGSSNLEIFKALNKEPIYKKQFLDEYIADIALNKNAKIVALVINDVESGEIVSKINVIDIKNQKEKFKIESKNNMMFFIDFISNKYALALGDNELIVVNAKNGKHKNYNFQNKKLSAFCVNKNVGFAVALSSSESGDDCEILIFNSGGKLKNTIKTDFKVNALSYNYGTVAALSLGKVYFYDQTFYGKNFKVANCDNCAKNIELISNNKAILLSPNKIQIASA